jgi:hypothetical protein
MPLWSEHDQKLVMQGTWWKQAEFVLPSLDAQQTSAPAPTPTTVVEETSVVDPFPVDTTQILDRFLPEYLQPDGDGLLDPQRFLTEIEREDVQNLINRIYELYKVRLYVSIFAKDQQVPAEVNAPTLARQVFAPEERCMLLHVHLGDVKSMQIACDSVLNDKIGDFGRRVLLQRVKENAQRYTDPIDELTEAMSAMVILVKPALISAAQKTPSTEHEEGKVDIPSVEIQYSEAAPPKRSAMADAIETFKAYCIQNATQLGIGILALVLAIVLVIWQRSIRPVELKIPEHLGDKGAHEDDENLLGCPNGFSCCQMQTYVDENDPHDTIGRQMIRDHMNNVSRP